MNDIKVFTVSTFDSIEIEKYIKPVTFHVVIGMNIFADFVQGITDIFGGNSESFQKRLKDINVSVIEGIKDEVKKAGGNCAIDLKIDNDEISAKGKSMIMVTAIATAVIIKESKDNLKSIFNDSEITEIDLEKYRVSKQLDEIKTTIESKLPYLNLSEYWNFFTDNYLTSHFSYLMNLLFEFSKENKQISAFNLDGLIDYLSIFNKEDITEKYYSFLRSKDNLNEYNILKAYLDLLDYEKLYYINNTTINLNLMMSDDELLFDCGFKLLLLELDSFNHKDIENYKKAITLFKDRYPIISTYENGVLTCSKCDGKTSRHKKCSRCAGDSRGIDRKSLLFDINYTSDELLEMLEKRIKYIQQAFEI